MDRFVVLTGEHDTIPAAELAALLAVHDPDATTVEAGPRCWHVTPGSRNAAATDDALRRLASRQSWGRHLASAPATDDGLNQLCGLVTAATDGEGSIAVRSQRVGAKAPAPADIERRIGAALAAAGHTINLDAPDNLVEVWRDGTNLHALVADAETGAIGRFAGRAVEDRDHFSPIALHPRRAATLIHLARPPPGGLVYDPFCGTGGILLEAALEGYAVMGSDRDAWMVQGTLTTLTDAGPAPLPGTVFESDIGDAPALAPAAPDAIVADLPYGRASGTDREPLRELYARALRAFRELLPVGGRAVVGLAEPDLLKPAAGGFEVLEHHAEFVHRSLTRHWMVLGRTR